MKNPSGDALQFSLPYTTVLFDQRRVGSADAILDLAGGNCGVVGRATGVSVGKASLCVRDDALRAEIQAISDTFDDSLASNKRPATIRMDGSEISAGGVDRLCAKVAKFFYSSWSRYCLPSVVVHVEHDGLGGGERQKLGLFITDEAGQWRSEMRVLLDNSALARDKALSLKVPVHFDGRMPSGNYILHAAIVDEHGWDWRAVSTIKLILN